MQFRDDMTLGEARALLRTLVDEGHRCPCCSQFAKVYKRKVHASMARGLIQAIRAGGRQKFVKPGDFLTIKQNCDFAKLAYWQLTVEEPTLREDGGRAGWWWVSDLGEQWIRMQATIPKYARIYDSRILGFEGPPVTIRDALGKTFDYAELMAGL